MSPLSFRILRLLQDGRIYSYDELVSLLGIPIKNIINSFNDIKSFGLQIQEIKGHGYCWDNSFQWLDKEKILSDLGDCCYHFNLEISDCLESTNSYFTNTLISPLFSNNVIHVLAAEMQTRGRGRNGRMWYSDLGNSLTFSLLWQFNKNSSFLQAFSLVVGIALIRSLRSLGFSGLSLKWPNDIQYSFRKLAGILVEVKNATPTSCFVIIGIGVNIFLSPSIKLNINQDVVDLYSISRNVTDRNKILASILTELSSVLSQFENCGFLSFKNEWISYHGFEGKRIKLQLPNGNCYYGIASGINDEGSLILRDAVTGIYRYFSVGEFSLR